MVRIEDDDDDEQIKVIIKIMTCRKCWTASGREAVGGAANNVAAIFLSIHESCNSWNCSLFMFEIVGCQIFSFYLPIIELFTAYV